jgi:uncharacterized protein YeaO (DUF488 family)
MAGKMILRAILAYFHDKSAANGGPISILGASKSDFTEFRATRYDRTNKAIRPWGVMSTTDEALQEWNKKVRPSAKDYKSFRDPGQWLEYKDSFMVTLESHGLAHLVDDRYVVGNVAVHKREQEFLYKVLKDNFTHHESKTIIKAHRKDKDILQIWKKICTTCEKSISTSMMADRLLGYLTGVNL